MLSPIHIKATNLPDAWYQTLFKCVEHGREFTIDQGSFKGQKRLELDYLTIHITCPDKGELLPKVNPLLNFPDPVAEGYLNDYMPYLMTGAEKKGESYTYGQRICCADADYIWRYIPPDLTIDELYTLPETIQWYDEYELNRINQMELMIWIYRNKGYRNNQMTLQVGQPSDMTLKDPPCLRHIDTRIQDGKLHFFPYFRSWDLFGGLPANLAAIETMKQYCAEQIGVGNGEIIASTKGGHLYDYVFEIAEAIRGKSIAEFRQES